MVKIKDRLDRIKRIAYLQGYRVTKKRAEDSYVIVDMRTGFVACHNGYGGEWLSREELVDFLNM